MYARQLGVSYTETLTLGRVSSYVTKNELEKLVDKFDTGKEKIHELDFSGAYAEPFFELLGAEHVSSLDYSDYEHADITQDLNKPWPDKYRNSFSVIFDGGTLEHVFNFPEAIKNCMKALKPGGHFISITLANNDNGHGFYQFSPELFFRIFSEENGFRVKKMILTPKEKNWYEVTDPNIVHSRVQFVNAVYTRLMLVAEKIADKEIFTSFPYQSDYTQIWNTNDQGTEKGQMKQQAGLKKIIQKVLPKGLKKKLRNLFDVCSGKKIYTSDMGIIDPKHLKKIEM